MSRRLLPLLVALLGAALLALPGVAHAGGQRAVDTTAESSSFELVNQARAANGLPALVTNAELVTIAREHSEDMARDVETGGSCGDGTTLRHRSQLDAGITVRWRMLRENVGCGYGSHGTAAVVHDGFMNSPGHRANILATDVNQVGVGAFRDVDGGLWITQIFMQADIVGPTPAPTPPTVTTGVSASRATFAADSASLAVIARADVFADSLGGVALAGGDGPILFTPAPSAANTDPKLDAKTRAELDRVLGGSGTVYILGGHVAIGPAVEDELRTAGYTVKRLAGAERFSTAVTVANEVVRRQGAPETILVAFGGNWPDAVTGGAAAARHGLPVVLSATDTTTAPTQAFLAKHPGAKRVVLGGAAVINDTVRSSIGARRVAGPDRAATAVAIAREVFGAPSGQAVVLHGYHQDAWASAMAWAARSARAGAPELFVHTDVPQVTADYVRAHDLTAIFGDAVASGTRTTVNQLVS